jgi:urea transport system substrate-binding protein
MNKDINELNPARRISRRSILRGMSALAAAPLAAPFLSNAAHAADAIRIGVISPLTGAWTVYGAAHMAGFELAVEEINEAGGVNGRPLEIVVGDSKTEPRIVVEQANRLLRQERVEFLAGTFSSAERNAAGPVVQQANKLMLYPTFYEGQSQEFFPGVCNKNMFMCGPEPSQQVWPHVEYIVKNHGKKFFLIGSDYAWPRETNKMFKQKFAEFGGEVVGESYIPFNTPEYESVLREIRASGAEVVFHSLTGSDTVNFRRQFHAAGMSKDIVIWTVDDEEVVTSGLGAEVSAGTYVSFDYFMTIETENNKVFLEKLFKKFGNDTLMNTVGVGMYNAAHLLAQAITAAGSTDTDKVRDALRGSSFAAAPQGSITMQAEDHQAILPSYLMKVREDWTSVNDMFEQVQFFDNVVPAPAGCTLPL